MERYLELMAQPPADKSTLFRDTTPPTMVTPLACGWINKEVNKPIAPRALRTRMPIMGAMEVSSMNRVSCRPDYVNTPTKVTFFDPLKAAYPTVPSLSMLLQSDSHKSLLASEQALQRTLVLHYLLPYSPNLNSIERLGKVMNEVARDNVFFTSAEHFREAVSEFFETTLSKIAWLLRRRIKDHVRILNPAPSG